MDFTSPGARRTLARVGLAFGDRQRTTIPTSAFAWVHSEAECASRLIDWLNPILYVRDARSPEAFGCEDFGAIVELAIVGLRVRTIFVLEHTGSQTTSPSTVADGLDGTARLVVRRRAVEAHVERVRGQRSLHSHVPLALESSVTIYAWRIDDATGEVASVSADGSTAPLSATEITSLLHQCHEAKRGG